MKQRQHKRAKHRREGPQHKQDAPAPPPTSSERRIDESLDASFPASDPPAHSSVSHPHDDDAIERGED